jgi:hypothetical protein
VRKVLRDGVNEIAPVGLSASLLHPPCGADGRGSTGVFERQAMRKRDELNDPKSCMSRARDDEWTFVLLGRDLAARVAVEAWIEERIRLGKNNRDDEQIREAQRWIVAVEDDRSTLAQFHLSKKP